MKHGNGVGDFGFPGAIYLSSINPTELSFESKFGRFLASLRAISQVFAPADSLVVSAQKRAATIQLTEKSIPHGAVKYDRPVE